MSGGTRRHRSPKGSEAMSHLDFVMSLLNVSIKAAQFVLVILQVRHMIQQSKQKRKNKKNRRS